MIHDEMLQSLFKKCPSEYLFHLDGMIDFARVRDLEPFRGRNAANGERTLRVRLEAWMAAADFPSEGDARLRLPDGSVEPAWFGSRFKGEPVPTRVVSREPIPLVFAPDERGVTNHNGNLDTLFDQEGVVYFHTISDQLNLPSRTLKELANRYPNEQECWREMGVRKLANAWLVRLVVFSRWYRTHYAPRLIDSVDPNWDGNALLRQKGRRFLLSEVTKKIPFSAHQLRYKARRMDNAKSVMGVCKEGDVWVVHIDPFAKWVKQVWQSSI
ncbi:hypothetical protein [Acanthopleuribacter pedis]|uniref:Uncharacterized protein n=1 Tax=Acanthopleuribacter pedis TaxID=442870 RepID=A0A8J7QNZ2_9BACT|nr:hypothetical protein [Acanthopleuribacter pedis]MBO1321953.1 hypothetical protein [Acanthopleuribacter pedis]